MIANRKLRMLPSAQRQIHESRYARRKEELRARRIWARYVRLFSVRVSGVCNPRAQGAGNDNIRVIAEPLHMAIPNISMNVIIRSRRHQYKWKTP